MKENKEKKIKNCDEISKLIKAFPKDIAALDKREEIKENKRQEKDKCVNKEEIMKEKLTEKMERD